ncbi:ribonuclease E [Micromonospora pattaloongensis]|uniref:Ribonuclease E n=1 Tax=Micromonospora pattaloongensis TaxID=405436 RepID=A0A1H3RLX8_9ACTN|nr:Rne/Rng family ribonuclease [Micromonospora pattaloongensis]SDZ26613.1 ribonuclease E [Micromonospora pattaloongensis]
MLDNEPEGGDRTGAQPAGETVENAAPARRARTTRRKSAGAAAEPTAAAEPGAAEEIAATKRTQDPADAAAAVAATEPAVAPEAVVTADAPVTPEAAVPAEPVATAEPAAAPKTRRRRKAAEPAVGAEPATDAGADGVPAAPVKATRTRRRKTADVTPEPEVPVEPAAVEPEPGTVEPGAAAVAPHTVAGPLAEPAELEPEAVEPLAEERPATRRRRAAPAAPTVLFMAPDPQTAPEPRRRPAAEAPAVPMPEAAGAAVVDEPETAAVDGTGAGELVETPKRRRRGRRGAEGVETAAEAAAEEVAAEAAAEEDEEEDEDDELANRRRRRRGRRGRGRGKGGVDETDDDEEAAEAAEADVEGDTEDDDEDEGGSLTRRRRRRRRRGAGEPETAVEDGVHTVVKIREPRRVADEVQGVSGSTRLEAKRQRRRDGREQRRTRPPILSESEFLARREAVDRVMVIRQRGDRTQVAVLEDGVLVEHYVTRASSGTMAGNVYLGKVQNVLPSMEAAFVDVGRGRNAVLYAGEVNWDATGLEGRARSIEQALRSGDSVLVQVTKDPIGHKGARLTSHIALSGRHLVYVPNGNASGISRKLPDNERKRLRDILKKLVPDGAGVIVRTAAEGASEDELARDVKRLQAQWEDIQAKAAEGGAPVLLYEEPDLVIRVVRDLFNEDFRELVVQGDESYEMVESYLSHVSPDLVARLRRHAGVADVFAEHRIDEQILKALDRKVFLPSGGHLVIDRTEAMTVVDVNTGKYTGTGGNLEETVTRNNLEAAEEIVRQLRLRDLGGIVVIDFIDMVLESNRELVLRRLTECLGRDRTKHQVTEITSLGLVQMTRKRIGAGLLEAFSETCDCCKGRGVIIHAEPVPEKTKGGAGDKVKAVASASSGPAPAASAPSTSSGSSRRRARKAAEAVPAQADEDDDTMGYDLSRYEVDTPPAESGNGSQASVPAAEPMRLAGAGDPDVADDAAGLAEDEFDGEPVDATSGGRRRSRRGGARRRTRP